MFFKYTNKIEEKRNQLKFIFNWPKEKILSVERKYIGKSFEKTIVVLDIEDKNYVKHEQNYEISREQHNELVNLLLVELKNEI